MTKPGPSATAASASRSPPPPSWATSTPPIKSRQSKGQSRCSGYPTRCVKSPAFRLQDQRGRRNLVGLDALDEGRCPCQPLRSMAGGILPKEAPSDPRGSFLFEQDDGARVFPGPRLSIQRTSQERGGPGRAAPKPWPGSLFHEVSAMPRYYFQLDARSDRADDNKGIECNDLDEAIHYAEEIASELRQHNPPEKIFGRYIVVSQGHAASALAKAPRVCASTSISKLTGRPCLPTPALWALRASFQAEGTSATCQVGRRIGSNGRIRRALQCGGRQRKIGVDDGGAVARDRLRRAKWLGALADRLFRNECARLGIDADEAINSPLFFEYHRSAGDRASAEPKKK